MRAIISKLKVRATKLSSGRKLSGAATWIAEAVFKEKVVGLDIGAERVKAVQLTRTRGGIRLLRTFEEEIRERDGEGKKEDLSRTLRELSDKIGGTEKIISALPLSSVIIRNFTLPFRDKDKIRQMIKFEAEPYLPFPSEEALVDFYVTDAENPKGTEVVMVAVNKGIVREHLDTLAAAGIEPQIIGLDAGAIFNAYAEGRQQEKPIALIDIGAEKTLVAIVSKSTLSFMRSIPRAGRAFTRAIAGELGIGFEEAEVLKREKGGLLSEPGEDKTRDRISTALKKALETWQQELERTFLSFEAHLSGEEIGEIILSGGSSKLTNLSAYLSDRLNVKVSLFRLFAHGDYKGEKSFPGDKATPSLNIALGLALSGLKGKRMFLNFRREEMAPRLEWGKLKKYLTPTIILVSLIVFLSLFNLFAQLDLQEKYYRNLNQEISRVVKATLPQMTKVPRGMEAAIIKNEIEKKEKRWEPFRNLTGDYPSALEVLRELHSRIPERLKLDISELVISGKTLRIKASTTSFEMVSKLRKALESSPYFERVELKSARTKLNSD